MTPVIMDASTTPSDQIIGATAYLERVQASEAIPLLHGPWHLSAIRELFRAFRVQVDWDSYGSPPPTSEAANRAIEFVTYVAAQGLDDSVPVPGVFPVPGGGLRLEWQSTNKELAVDILPDGSLEFLRAQDEHIMDEGALAGDRIPALLEWVTAV